MLVLGERGLAVSRVLCIGAHSDDIEIGCGGTLMRLIERCPGLSVDWLVLSASDDRRKEAEASAVCPSAGVGRWHPAATLDARRWTRGPLPRAPRAMLR